MANSTGLDPLTDPLKIKRFRGNTIQITKLILIEQCESERSWLKPRNIEKASCIVIARLLQLMYGNGLLIA